MYFADMQESNKVTETKDMVTLILNLPSQYIINKLLTKEWSTWNRHYTDYTVLINNETMALELEHFKYMEYITWPLSLKEMETYITTHGYLQDGSVIFDPKLQGYPSLEVKAALEGPAETEDEKELKKAKKEAIRKQLAEITAEAENKAKAGTGATSSTTAGTSSTSSGSTGMNFINNMPNMPPNCKGFTIVTKVNFETKKDYKQENFKNY